MKFFFPDSQDQVDPSFDFITEERDPRRIRQRDDRYAHEILSLAPYDGVLVSKTIVDGTARASAGKYTGAQRQRLYSEGTDEFFRLSNGAEPLVIMGDCGAFSYHEEEYPPYTVDEVIDFYEGCEFDFGISVDHLIFEYSPSITRKDSRAKEWARRQDITLELAAEFRARSQGRQAEFVPVGVAQGWSPASYAEAVTELQRIGFKRIALGGMVPLKTPQILECLRAVDDIRQRETQLHLLGISRCDDIRSFAKHGVTSFDSTSPFRQAFKDERDNYYAPDCTYIAVRVPQVDGNAKLKKRILSGEVDQRQAIKLERAALDLLRRYDRNEVDVEPVLAALDDYSQLWDGKTDRTNQYRRTLTDRPWQECPCAICRTVGIEVILFRGSERNKRRGFHNLFVFEQQLRLELGKDNT